jgi:hypothetical protein
MMGLIDQRGSVSIAELMAAIVVSAMTMSAIYRVTLMQSQVYGIQNQMAERDQIVESVKGMMVRELEMAGYRPMPTAVFDGITLDTTRLRIRADINGNGVTTEAREDITYQFDAANLRIIRTTGGAALVFPNIQGFTLTYLRADGGNATTSAEIRQVNVVHKRTGAADKSWVFKAFQRLAGVWHPRPPFMSLVSSAP